MSNVLKPVFKKVFPSCKEPDLWLEQIETLLPKYKIDTLERITAFLAQCGYESGGWRIFEENLNYSARSLKIVFSKYFRDSVADPNKYARNPEKIANYVYANRMGNGSIQSGDGWKYRGRGPIQITGKANYLRFFDDFEVEQRDPNILALDKEISLKSAIWFWNSHNLNELADAKDLVKITRIINGGENGLKHRLNYYNTLTKELTDFGSCAEHYTTKIEPITQFKNLKLGSVGINVALVQKFLGFKIQDGVFGLDTDKAVRKWQKSNGLYPDGVVGEKTFKKMFK